MGTAVDGFAFAVGLVLVTQVFIKRPASLLVCQDIPVDGFMMELGNPIFFQPASDLFRAPILLKIAIDEQHEFICELDGLGLVFMVLFGQSIGLFVSVSP